MIFKSFYKHFSALVFDTSFLHYFSTIIFYSIRHQLLCRIISKKAVDSTAFFVILRQISTAKARRCKKCCRFMSKNIVEKNCCRKLPSKNVGEKYCQNILSKKTVIDSVFRQISPKNLKNFVECRCFMSKNVVEKNCCRIIIRQFFSSAILVSKIRHHFQTAFFDKNFCRKTRSKNVVERS